MEHWTDFGVGQLPSFSARKRAEFPPPIEALVGELAVAIVAIPQHGHRRPGSTHSVTVLVTCTSTTCAHPGPAGAAPPSPAPQRRHWAGGSA
jgi:hypothetical protein